MNNIQVDAISRANGRRFFVEFADVMNVQDSKAFLERAKNLDGFIDNKHLEKVLNPYAGRIFTMNTYFYPGTKYGSEYKRVKDKLNSMNFDEVIETAEYLMRMNKRYGWFYDSEVITRLYSILPTDNTPFDWFLNEHRYNSFKFRKRMTESEILNYELY